MAELVSDERLKKLREEHHRYIILLAGHFEFEPKKYISQMREALTNLMELSQGREVGPAPRIDNQLSPRVRPPPRTARLASPRTARLASPRTARPASPSTASSSSDASYFTAAGTPSTPPIDISPRLPDSRPHSPRDSSSSSDDGIPLDYVFEDEDKAYCMIYAILQVLIRIYAFNEESFLKEFFHSARSREDLFVFKKNIAKFIRRKDDAVQILSQILRNVSEFNKNTLSTHEVGEDRVNVHFYVDPSKTRFQPANNLPLITLPDCYIHVLDRHDDTHNFVVMPPQITLNASPGTTFRTYSLYGVVTKKCEAFIKNGNAWDKYVMNTYEHDTSEYNNRFKKGQEDDRIIFVYRKSK